MAEKREKIHTKGEVLRCPNCGASDAEFDIDAGGLRCLYCHEVFMSPKINQYGGFEELIGEVHDSGAKDLRYDEYVVTFKCPSCGAMIMLDKDSKDIHCHWCRHNLNVSEKIPNGEMPDLILPFKVSKKLAYLTMKNFAEERKVFSIGRFHLGLKEENLRAVYLPYVLVDVRAKVKMNGAASEELEDGRLKSMKVEREFELRIDDLTVEASHDKLHQDTIINTNHVINAILPFDTEEAVAWDSRYLKGYSCERRDVDIEELKRHLDYQIANIAKAQIDEKIKDYTRGIPGDVEIEYIGRKWKTAFFPVWLYSCRGMGISGKRKIHYVAVNGRTGEIMGSVPVGKVLWNIILFVPLIAVIILTGFSAKLGMTQGQVFALVTIALIVYVSLTLIANSRTEEYVNKDAHHNYIEDTYVTTTNDKDNSKIVDKSLMPQQRKYIIRDEKGKETQVYLDAVIIRNEDKEATFIEPEKFYEYMLFGLVLGAFILIMGLILTSQLGLL